jgi:hypothetical protein
MVAAAATLHAFPAESLAGQIYGQITAGGRSVSEGVEVVIACGGASSASTRTDRFGAYQLYVDAGGRCQITVRFRGAAVVGDVVSYANPVRYNFDIVEQDGKPRLMRR